MKISVEDFNRLPAGATIVNAGKHQGRRELRGAVRYRPSDLLDAEHLALPLAHDTTLVVYGEHGPDDDLARIAERFRSEGYTDVRILDASLADVERAGGATQEASLEQVVPPHQPGEVQELDRRV